MLPMRCLSGALDKIVQKYWGAIKLRIEILKKLLAPKFVGTVKKKIFPGLSKQSWGSVNGLYGVCLTLSFEKVMQPIFSSHVLCCLQFVFQMDKCHVLVSFLDRPTSGHIKYERLRQSFPLMWLIYAGIYRYAYSINSF